MTFLHERSFRITLISIVAAGLLLAILWLLAGSLVDRALRRLAASAEPSGYHVRFEAVDLDLRKAHLRLSGLRVEPTQELLADERAPHFSLKADAVDLRGVDLKALLFRGILRVGRLSLEQPAVEHSHITLAAEELVELKRRPERVDIPGGLARISFDTLIVSGASGRSVNRTRADRTMSVDRIDLHMTGVRFMEQENGRLQLEDDDAQLHLQGISMGLPPFHTLTIDRVHLDAHTDELLIISLAYSPLHGPKSYHRHVTHQQELVSASADTLFARGFDLAGNLYEGSLRAELVRVHGLVLRSYRDKSIARGEAIRKPLPAESVRAMGLPVAIDTIAFQGASVHYGERQEREDDYGILSFTGIHGMLTGLSNLPSDAPTDLRLQGEARLYQRGSLAMDLRMPMHAGSDRVTIRATLRNLPFEVLNRMTNNLVHVNATDGRIQLVDVRFSGNERQASGTVDVHYEDLKLKLTPQVRHAKALSLLANTLVRSSNLPGDRRYRQGTFTVERARDKSVFNYLWLGVREGMLEVMLPPVVLKQVKKAQQNDRQSE